MSTVLWKSNKYASGIYYKAGEFQGKGRDNIVGLWNGKRKVYIKSTIPGIIGRIPSTHFGGGYLQLSFYLPEDTNLTEIQCGTDNPIMSALQKQCKWLLNQTYKSEILTQTQSFSF